MAVVKLSEVAAMVKGKSVANLLTVGFANARLDAVQEDAANLYSVMFFWEPV